MSSHLYPGMRPGAKLNFPLHISKQTAQIVVCRTVESCCKGGAAYGFESPDHWPSTFQLFCVERAF